MDFCSVSVLLKDKLSDIPYVLNQPLSSLNRYESGGKALAVVYPDNLEQLKRTVLTLKGEVPYFVLGGGSNVLVSDKGFDGVVISTKKVNKITVKGCVIIAESGAKLSSVISEAVNNSYSGLEFAVGIPATVGGAVAMNAGCYNKTVADVVSYVVTENATYNNQNSEFSYRSSRFLQKETILKVAFSLTPCESDEIEEKLKEYKSFRKNPKGKNCGSVFRNDGFFAGKIIDEAGLKGLTYGKAKISNEHANFIIAENGCTSYEIYKLIKTVKEKVYSKKGVELNEEIVYLGDF